jgi:twitching motility protein PilT
VSKIGRQLGQLLVDSKLMNKDDMEHHLARAEEAGTPLPRLLISEGAVRREDILAAVAGELSLEFFNIDPKAGDAPQPEAMGRLDGGAAAKLTALPMRVDESGLIVAVPDPFNTEKKQLLERAVGGPVVLGLAARKPLELFIKAAYAEFGEAHPEAAASTRSADIIAAADRGDYPHVNELLEKLIDMEGSDLHLTAGSPPQIRINGHLEELDGYPMMVPATLRSMIYDILTGRQREELEESRELDCSHPLPGKGRFRVNVFFQRDSVGAVMRAIPNEIKSLEELMMPAVVSTFAHLPRGLLLVTGPTGSGKSTTLASVIHMINTSRSCHIITVEDPIEFMHKHERAIVNQREVGSDTLGFTAALKHALRQDPDVILVGEMRDLETIGTAITAAETGHLVLGTLHTQDAPQSIDRVIDMFPSHQQQQVRVQLSGSIQAVVSQQLVRTVDGKGRVPAVEVMVATPAVRNLIREGKTHQIASVIQSGAKHGMQTLDQSLAALVKKGTVSMEAALERAQDPDELRGMVGKG